VAPPTVRGGSEEEWTDGVQNVDMEGVSGARGGGDGLLGCGSGDGNVGDGDGMAGAMYIVPLDRGHELQNHHSLHL
jgi:hypothetical protein